MDSGHIPFYYHLLIFLIFFINLKLNRTLKNTHRHVYVCEGAEKARREERIPWIYQQQ